MLFLAYIEKNYNQIKKMLLQYKDFDEDIFHNTIIKCNDIVNENDLRFNNENTMLRYFIGAYKTNLLREKYYYCNKNVDHNIEDQYDISNDDENSIEKYTDINIILDKVELEFGTELKNIYVRYITEDKSILKLLEETGIKNLKLKIKDIKTFIMSIFEKEEF